MSEPSTMQLPEWLKSVATVLIGMAASLVLAWVALYLGIGLLEAFE